MLDANAALIDDLVSANRILAAEGVVDGFGHVSVRSDKNPQHFYISRSLAPQLVTASDILELDFKGDTVDGTGRSSYLERFIHAAIYQARPDVMSVVHSHSPAVIPFGVTGVPLQPVYHCCGFLGVGSPIFDSQKVAGDTDMLISNLALGEALAAELGDKPVALMRGHGSVVVGISIKQVVYRAVYTEVNARLQMEAMRLGPVTYLTSGEAAKGAATNDNVLDRPWDLWKNKAFG